MKDTASRQSSLIREIFKRSSRIQHDRPKNSQPKDTRFGFERRQSVGDCVELVDRHGEARENLESAIGLSPPATYPKSYFSPNPVTNDFVDGAPGPVRNGQRSSLELSRNSGIRDAEVRRILSRIETKDLQRIIADQECWDDFMAELFRVQRSEPTHNRFGVPLSEIAMPVMDGEAVDGEVMTVLDLV